MVYHILGSGGGSDVLRVNYEGTVRLFEAFASAGGRRFIGAGTCFEYGHQQAGQIHEDTPCTPIYDYAIAKARATETVLDRAARQGVEAALLRVFSPYGTMEDPQRLIPQLFRAARAESPLDMTPGEQVRDYTLVDDVAAAFVAAATAPLACPQRVFNVCSGIGHTVRQVADAVGGALGRPVPVRWGRLPYRPNEMMRLVGCPRRIQAELGWRALWSLEDGLRRSATAASRVA
jgi:dTDP-6-deoxy-L-talose 4-dehydrogenase (NAD+)